MKLKLNKPIVFIDLETTGLDVENDKIVQIAICKLMPDGSRETKARYVNPGIKIPDKSTEIHGITDEMVKDAPRFEQIAKSIISYIDGCDLGGFNSNAFDYPLLSKEFQRASLKFDFTAINLIDIGNIYKILNPRTLAAAYKNYVGVELDDAHNAEVDINATVDVFVKQIEQHEEIPSTVEEIALFSNYNRKMADLSGKFYYDDEGALRFNFGKYRNELATDHPDFLQWMVFRASFSTDTYNLAYHALNNS